MASAQAGLILYAFTASMAGVVLAINVPPVFMRVSSVSIFVASQTENSSPLANRLSISSNGSFLLRLIIANVSIKSVVWL